MGLEAEYDGKLSKKRLRIKLQEGEIDPKTPKEVVFWKGEGNAPIAQFVYSEVVPYSVPEALAENARTFATTPEEKYPQGRMRINSGTRGGVTQMVSNASFRGEKKYGYVDISYGECRAVFAEKPCLGNLRRIGAFQEIFGDNWRKGSFFRINRHIVNREFRERPLKEFPEMLREGGLIRN